MEQVSVIGCGRWGTFLGWYMANYCHADTVLMYDMPNSPTYLQLLNERKNDYLTLSDNMLLTSDIQEVLKNDFIIISISCQNLRKLAKQLNTYNLDGKTFLLAMKGLEEPSAEILADVFAQEVKQNVHIATLGGPGHVEDYMRKVPSAAVIDSFEHETQDRVIKLMHSDLIRLYYGSDIIGNQVGAALKNVIGLAAGILDGLGWYGLKGALMARAPIEVGRLIKFKGGNPESVYGLAHLGDYEATLFSRNSHNRMFGENFAKGEPYTKLAEGVDTLRAVKAIADKEHIDMPICQALYKVIFEKADIKQTIRELFERSLKKEF
ncbi:MAG: glycerol-3-phosphate dehydrogenase [Alphaproteobacteria bacterium]|nr:glycerol-3-phosphate dehydrogenase [Alphaproteobacteria bacterium]